MKTHEVKVDFITVNRKPAALITGAKVPLSEETLEAIYTTDWFDELVALTAVQGVTTVARFKEIRVGARSGVPAEQFDSEVEAKLGEFFVLTTVNRRQ